MPPPQDDVVIYLALLGYYRENTVCSKLCDHVLLLQEAPVLFRVAVHGRRRKPSSWCSTTLLSTDGYTPFRLYPGKWARLPLSPGAHQGPWNLTGRDHGSLTNPPGAEDQSERDQWSRCVAAERLTKYRGWGRNKERTRIINNEADRESKEGKRCVGGKKQLVIPY